MDKVSEPVSCEKIASLAAAEVNDRGFDRELPAHEFRDDDSGYLEWIAANPDRYVINIARGHYTSAARLHLASCRTISGEKSGANVWTGSYVKVCGCSLAALEEWEAKNVAGQMIPPCGTCQPTRQGGEKPGSLAATPSEPVARHEVHGPVMGAPEVVAWADDYIRFERRPPWQDDLRNEIRNGCGQLAPSADEVLHATFFGPKHPKADVENLLLYYIDSFRAAGHNGIRFEHGATVPSAPSGVEYRYCYRYAMAPRTAGFADWQQGRRLASFDWADLGAFGGDKKLAHVWWALARTQLEVFDVASPQTAFAVKVEIRPPTGGSSVWGGLVKGIFDGVICALQTHTDRTVLPEATARLSKYIPAEAIEIEEQLLDPRRAVLGAVRRLVSPYRDGVKWDPSDHMCVAGELLVAESTGPSWAIRGKVVEVSR